VGRALKICADGEKAIKKLPDFSCDNFGDTFRLADESGSKSKQRRILVRRATGFVATLKTFDDDTWGTLFELARAYIPRDEEKALEHG
jgi:hypothetical protein